MYDMILIYIYIYIYTFVYIVDFCFFWIQFELVREHQHVEWVDQSGSSCIHRSSSKAQEVARSKSSVSHRQQRQFSERHAL